MLSLSLEDVRCCFSRKTQYMIFTSKWALYAIIATLYIRTAQWKRMFVNCSSAIRGFLIGKRFTGILSLSGRDLPPVHFGAIHSIVLLTLFGMQGFFFRHFKQCPDIPDAVSGLAISPHQWNLSLITDSSLWSRSSSTKGKCGAFHPPNRLLLFWQGHNSSLLQTYSEWGIKQASR